ncbi:FecCD family ABC transporter permease [Kaarinaea lacus]
MDQNPLPHLYKRPLSIFIALMVLTPLCLLLALAMGSSQLSFADLTTIFSTAEESHRQVILNLRLPRTLSAFITGGLLALSGVLMQALLRNPLADPYILGVSGGAAVGALCAMLFGLGSFWLTSSAFCGALLSMLIVFSLAHGRGSWSATRLLLTGVVVAAGWGAVISFILSISPERNLHGMLFWLMGDLSYAPTPTLAAIVLAVGLLLAMWLSKSINVLTRGDLTANALGVEVTSLRLRLYVVASLLTATAVTLAGSIGFLGLITPHLLRLAGIHDHRFLIPTAVMFGGILLVLADTVARTVMAPQQLPIGVITALVGVPLFLYLMHKSQTQL